MRILDRLLGSPTPLLKGDRLVLRGPRAADYEEWRELREASRDFLVPWEPRWLPDELSRKSYLARLSRYGRDARQRSGYSFFLFDRGSGVLCGGITLGQIRRGVAQTGVLGYWMGERFAGRGRMSEAVRMVAAHAFETERLHRLEAACLPRNLRSIRLLEKSGFTCEGELRKYLMIGGEWEDHRLYSLLSEDRTPEGHSLRPSPTSASERKADPDPHG